MLPREVDLRKCRSAMGVRRRLKQLWKKRPTLKFPTDFEAKTTDAPAGDEILELDEALAIVNGIGLRRYNTCREWDMYDEGEDFDPRFLVNPYGIGCSKSFENPLSTETTNSGATPSTPTSTIGRPPWIEDTSEGDYRHSPMHKTRESLFPARTWSGLEVHQIDWSKEKRKGRATGVEPQDDGLQERFADITPGNATPKIERVKELMTGMRPKSWTY
ncbi:hypothetical protein ACLMJK_005549 [Lecanora helva]